MARTSLRIPGISDRAVVAQHACAFREQDVPR
jgi:hypothetical protein